MATDTRDADYKVAIDNAGGVLFWALHSQRHVQVMDGAGVHARELTVAFVKVA